MTTTAKLFLTGGVGYPLLELLSRGRTDVSMAAAGGVCLCLIEKICCTGMKGKHWIARCAAGSGIITGVEFLTGLVVNVGLKMNVWDYSGLPGNFLGQICPAFSLVWFFITIPAMGICAFMKNGKKKKVRNL